MACPLQLNHAVAAKEHTLERIKYYTELLRFLWILIGAGSGTASLTAALVVDAWKPMLLVVRIIGMAVVVTGLALVDRRIRESIRALQEL